ncbi:MAG: hypothetical protein COV45_00465 [Deltaproteobacteria bacterium CG11_big_fil_rev_8_21_14_0_20_47_16]|nr:MAG: hypothetical protein COV45_00465 [Deltaproteobacteria bacterium CG11_big_fil_rev_8_21_14_0_20_47_16]
MTAKVNPNSPANLQTSQPASRASSTNFKSLLTENSAELLNLHAARTSSTGGYTTAATKTPVEQEIAQAPKAAIGGLWRKA